MNRLFVIPVLLFISAVLAIPNNSFSQASPAELATLQGLNQKGIGVRVENVDADAAADGLDVKKLEKIITQKIKKAGVKVITNQEVNTLPGQPRLVLNINTVKQPGPIYIYTTSLDVYQIVILARNNSLSAVSPTWSVLTTGGALPEDLHKSVEASLAPLLDSFIRDYKVANP
ncbi:MAG: hypothetical protein AAF462_05660 [Thermodesulfobacteriota bacterium]